MYRFDVLVFHTDTVFFDQCVEERTQFHPTHSSSLEALISAFAVTDDPVARTAAVEALFTADETPDSNLKLDEDDLVADALLDELLLEGRQRLRNRRQP